MQTYVSYISIRLLLYSSVLSGTDEVTQVWILRRSSNYRYVFELAISQSSILKSKKGDNNAGNMKLDNDVSF
jgi:hypothetical protein